MDKWREPEFWERETWWQLMADRSLWAGISLVLVSWFVTLVGLVRTEAETAEGLGRALRGGFWIFASGWLFLLFSTVTNFIIKVMRKEEWTMPGQE